MKEIFKICGNEILRIPDYSKKNYQQTLLNLSFTKKLKFRQIFTWYGHKQ